MNPSDPRIIEYQKYIQEHSKCGAAFYFDTLLRYINSNRECSLLMLNNGLEFCKAQMKLNALTDARHSDEEIERRLTEIDEDIRIGLMDSSVAVPARACPCETEIPFGQYLQSPFVDACVSLMRSFFDTEGWPNGMEVGLPIFL